jgi:hypothetical protein
MDAVGAETVPGEPGEQFVLLGDLTRETPRNPVPTTRAGDGLCLGDRRGKDVFTRFAPKLEVGTLTELASVAESDLVDAGAVMLRRDQQNLLNRVKADLVRVPAVESDPSGDAGGWWSYTLHVNLLSRLAVLRGIVVVPPGHFLSNKRIKALLMVKCNQYTAFLC